MQRHDIDAVFRRTFKGRTNFMTPDIQTRGKKRTLLYEISSGDGINGGRIYGVTFLTLTGRKLENVNKCCDTYQEALRYIEEVAA